MATRDERAYLMITKTCNPVKLVTLMFLTTVFTACSVSASNTPKPTTLSMQTESPVLAVTLTFEPEYVAITSIKTALRTDNPHAPRVIAFTSADEEKCDMLVSWVIVGTSTDSNINADNVRDDTTRIIRAIAQNDFRYTCVVLEAYWPTSETTDKLVVKLIYKKSTVDMINWNTFTSDDIYIIADSSFVDSAFQGK